MCAICMKIPCDSRCPNAPEIKPVHICIDCGSAIFSGEKYFEGPDGPICKDLSLIHISVGTTSTRTLESVADEDGTMHAAGGWTEIFIYPGYKFKCIDALITNFHLPESTLLMLVSALAGKEHIMHAYETAVQERYRFFSFGDAMFIE